VGRQLAGQRVGGAPADTFANLIVGECEDALLGLQRVLVSQIIGRKKRRERIVDEV
jgi:hypothetical protein